jgi:cysteine desulfurase
MKLPIYLDNQATTPVDPRVLEAMLPFLQDDFGNAASKNHLYGWRAEAAVDKARAQVATLIGALPREVIFTSGATESNNLALKGTLSAQSRGAAKNHVITVETEHTSVLDPCRRLERQRLEHLERLRRLRWMELHGRIPSDDERETLGEDPRLEGDPVLRRWLTVESEGAEVTYLPVLPDGRISLDVLKGLITERTALVSVMLANNEIGVVQPVDEVGALCRERGVLFHCDAAQGVGKVPFDVRKAKVDLVSVSAHKLYGPKGVGALYVRTAPGVRLVALQDGGGHERGLRSGTLDVAGIVGLGKACELALAERDDEAKRLLALREELRSLLFQGLEHVSINGSLDHRLPGNLNVSFGFVRGDALMRSMKDLAVSAGSACTSASLEPSYVLRALGIADELAHGSLRFGLGRFTTAEDIHFAAQTVIDAVKRLRAIDPVYQLAQQGVDPQRVIAP